MKLLFDQNLSPSLVTFLSDLYPDSTHVYRVGLSRATDQVVYRFAKRKEFTIVTKDADFGDLGLIWGFPPRIIWLQLGNCTTKRIAEVLRNNDKVIVAFGETPDLGILVLSG